MGLLKRILEKYNTANVELDNNDNRLRAGRFSTQSKTTTVKGNSLWTQPAPGKFNLDRVSDDYFYLFI